MSKQAIFTMKLEPELHDTFIAEATADDQSAARCGVGLFGLRAR